MPIALKAHAIRIDDLPPEPLPADLDGLARLLCDAVESGASVSFMAGLTVAEARDFWVRKLASRLARSAALVARDAGGIIGTVHLEPAWAPNQPHRAEVAKLLVHRRARRLGLGEALMTGVTTRAAAEGFSLLTLDTASADAERLYRRLGWSEAGVIPGFALNPDGTPCDTVLFFKTL